MQIIFLSASDFYYVPRVENLTRQFIKCSAKLAELENQFNEYVELNNPSLAQLNILSSQIETVIELMDAISKKIRNLRLEFCN